MSTPAAPVVLFADNFSSYPIGSYPTGWGGGGGATVQNDPLGFYPRVLQIGPNQLYQELGSLYTTASVYFGFCVNSGTPGPYVYSFANGPGISNQTIRLVDLTIETDGTISLRHGLELVGNSGQSNIYINPSGWNYVQINITISAFNRPGDMVPCISVTCDLGLNGFKCFSGAVGNFPDVPVGNLYYPTPKFNLWLFNDPNIEGGPLANVYLCELTELNLFPFDFNYNTVPATYLRDMIHGTMSNVFDSQSFLEVMEDPDIADESETNLRVTQGFIEVMELPLVQKTPLIEFPNLRISQIFIELMIENGNTPPPSSQGGHVYES